MAFPLSASAFGGFNPYVSAGIAGLGALGDIFGGQNVSGLTQSDIDNAMAIANKGYNQAFKEYDRPVNIGGTNTSMGASPGERKVQAAIDYFVSQGLSPEAAQKKADKIAKAGGKSFKDVKGFKNFIRNEGDKYNLSVGTGGGIGGPKATFNFQAPTDALQGMSPALASESFAAAAGLPSEFARDTREGLDFKKQIRDIVSGQFTDLNAEFDPSADIQDIKNAQSDYVRGLLPQLMDTGFMDSSLTKRIFNEGLDKSSTGLYTDLLNRSQEFKLAKAGNFNNLINTANSLYGPQTFGQYIGGSFVDPTEYGGFTAPQAYTAGLSERSGRAGLKQNQASTVSNIAATPRYEDQGGFLGF